MWTLWYLKSWEGNRKMKIHSVSGFLILCWFHHLSIKENLVKWVVVYLKGLLLGHRTVTHTQTAYTTAHTHTYKATQTHRYIHDHIHAHSLTDTLRYTNWDTHTHWYTTPKVSIISLLSRVCAAKTSWPICLPASLFLSLLDYFH